MNELLRHSTQPAWRMGVPSALGAVGLALGSALVLGACAHNGGTDDVKPTATTAYHSAQPAAQPSAPASSTAPE